MILLYIAVFSKKLRTSTSVLSAPRHHALYYLLPDQTATSWIHFLGLEKQLIVIPVF
jgi:hypothetical protein